LTCVYVDQNPIGVNPRSNPATYTGLSNVIRDVFASASGASKSVFSFNTSEGSCPECDGTGTVEVRMRYLPSARVECSACGGKRFSDEAIAVRIRFGGMEITITDFYKMSADEAISLFEKDGALSEAKKQSALSVLRSLHDTGLGYLELGQPSPSLSGGEAQRIKLAKYLSKPQSDKYLIVLDEPTTGLHPSDVRDLLAVLARLVDTGATIIVIEHDIDVIRSADWIVDLGPGAGPAGGGLVYQGDAIGFKQASASPTARMLNDGGNRKPSDRKKSVAPEKNGFITIRNARANNLKNVSVKIPKSRLTVVTGISGSGKSSLVHDIIENEAKHLFFESLSVYERYNTREKTEIEADSVRGLGITMSIGAKQNPRDVRLSVRSTVGTVSEISYHLGVLFSFSGRRNCPSCGKEMARKNTWVCPSCGTTDPIGEPHHFLGFNYASACRECNGVGTVQVPNSGKLIRNPDKPLCAGAMYSPGFFPQGYLAKPYNGGYYVVMAFAEKYGFDPFTLPWNKMTKEAQDAFLFGDTQLRVRQESRKAKGRTYDFTFHGFYGTWLRDWDMFGTYSDIAECPGCKGSKLKTEYNAVTIGGYDIHTLNLMSLKKLKTCMDSVKGDLADERLIKSSFDVVKRRLGFLIESGLGYVSLARLSSTLSAGEAQRVRLAALLGSDLHSITVLLDEPTRGLHPAEIGTLVACLKELAMNDNTVIVVEHDPLVIASADHVIDMGPGSGAHGGKVVFEGTPDEIRKTKTSTGIWIDKLPTISEKRDSRAPEKWFVIKGAKENNLKIDELAIPYGMLTGICGVSGSGKSTLMIDTIGRILSPGKHTTSISYEPLAPGVFDSIGNPPGKTVVVDQAITGITNPSDYLGITRLAEKYFASSDERLISGIDAKLFRRCCSACKGRGWVKMNFSFLPDVTNACAVCGGTGYPEEIGSVTVRGLSLPAVFGLTIDDASAFFADNEAIRRKCETASKCGIGYLVLRQHSHALSGGEVQRLKIAEQLCGDHRAHTFYILDEPTVGLHMEDVSKLIVVLKELVTAGNTVIVIEHHPYLLSSCDYLIELGPGGGEDGGKLIYCGDARGIINANTPTSSYLKDLTGERG
jgi:excinuclease ABC subunit A